MSQATALAGSNQALTGDLIEQAIARYSPDRRGLGPPLPRLAETLGTDAAKAIAAERGDPSGKAFLEKLTKLLGRGNLQPARAILAELKAKLSRPD